MKKLFPKGTARAFTLIEVLVIGFTVVMIVAFLIPAFSGSHAIKRTADKPQRRAQRRTSLTHLEIYRSRVMALSGLASLCSPRPSRLCGSFARAQTE